MTTVYLENAKIWWWCPFTENPRTVSWTSSQPVSVAADFCCGRMAHLVNKYHAIHFVGLRIKHHISIRECHFSCQQLAMSLSLPWPITYGECDALNLLQQTETGVHTSEGTQTFKRKMLLSLLGCGTHPCGEVQGLELKHGKKKARKII